MREVSLFSGAGGGLLGSLILGWRTVAAVEIDPYCQRVLCARGGYVADAECHGRLDDEADRNAGIVESPAGQMGGAGSEQAVSAGSGSKGFPVYGDIRTFHPEPDSCDIVTGGFPCQPFSHAGKRLGEDDSRNMWPHAVRVLVESGAPLGFFENVPGLLSSGYFGTILGDLAEGGFDAQWCVLGADDVGAPHRRKRLWILAYSPSHLRGTPRHDERVAFDGAGTEVAYARCRSDESLGISREFSRETGAAEREGHQRERSRDAVGSGSPWWCDPADADPDGEQAQRPPESWEERDPWLLEPYVGRVVAGIPERVGRLRALGNAQCPQSMAAAFTLLARDAGIQMMATRELPTGKP